MALSPDQIEYALELFDGVGPLTTKRMFGGMCLYRDGIVFALVRSDGTVMLKARGAFKDRVEAEGWTPWHHVRKNGVETSMPYWELPGAALDDPEVASVLAAEALREL
ncbi:TfoX-like protein [Rhodobacterales bacterium HKCCE2091]|nr:TfoX-like protein [Rhodobacterales bacterium HKCCE2091]